MKRISNLLIISSLLILVMFSSCDPIVPEYDETIDYHTSFFLLNEGNWGSNNASIGFFNSQTTEYKRDAFSQINSNIVGGLGDVGNDLLIYGGKLYAVINASGLVEVMDAKTAKHIGVVNIPNSRNINFYNGKIYVSSWADATMSNANVVGYVAEIDTATLQVVRSVNVGRQPEEIEFLNGKMYVANSGGYTTDLDSTISVVDLQTFNEQKKIVVAKNLQKLRKAGDKLYVLALGNYYNIAPDIYVVENDEKVGKLDIYASNFCVSGDLIYILSNKTDWSAGTTISKFIIYNIANQQIVTENFITDGTEAEITTPYGIAVNPITRDIFITDAKNYSTSGELFCFSPDGKKLWSVTTGVAPNKIVFLKK